MIGACQLRLNTNTTVLATPWRCQYRTGMRNFYAPTLLWTVGLAPWLRMRWARIPGSRVLAGNINIGSGEVVVRRKIRYCCWRNIDIGPLLLSEQVQQQYWQARALGR